MTEIFTFFKLSKRSRQEWVMTYLSSRMLEGQYKVEVPQHSIVKAKPLPEWTPPPKPWATADGVVNQVVCSQFDLMLTLQVSGFTLKLHTSNFKGPPYYATGGATRDGFDPCKGLRGRTVKIEYAPVLSKPYVGELASIEIEE
jgi:hypothetical protein